MTVQASLTPAARASASGPKPQDRLGKKIWRDRWVYLFLLPTVVLFGAYSVWPTISSLYYSLLDWTGLGQARPFVGLANYGQAFGDPLFWKSLGVTMLIIIVTVPVRVFLALVLALFLNNPRLPFVRLLRTAFFVPVVATTAIIGIVMNFIFDPAGGPVNSMLASLGVQPIDFLGSSSTALWTVMGVHVWKWLGLTLMYWLAALQTVPNDLYEAAQIDGAGKRQTFFGITIPMLAPFIVIISLLTVVETMQIFDLVQTMTGGGPFFSTLVTEVYIYQQAFATPHPEYGYASAMGVLLGIVTMLIVGTYLLLSRIASKRKAIQ
ncbi:sugar ABC transporter permease [Glaciihabitans sp. UYNi722]|uniref:carbohydrate ABC transporter permease n=1 Tax=Glaciihabitans sp. UYNi722 TaxID=3156344 RepID=UPI003399451B